MATAVAKRPVDSYEPAYSGGQRKDFARFLRMCRMSHEPSRERAEHAAHVLDKEYGSEWVQDQVVTKSAMGETTGEVGGYLLPTNFYTDVFRPYEERSIIWPRALKVSMTSAQANGPYIDAQTAQTAGTSPFFGGLVGGWGFSQAPAENEPAFRQQVLTAWDLIGYAAISNQMLDDMQDFGKSHLLDMFARWAAWQADYAFFQGGGAPGTMPLGVINAGAAILVTRAVPSKVQLVDIAGMVASLMPYCWENAIWAASPTAAGQLVQLPGWIANQHRHDDGCECAGYLENRPLFITEKVSKLGTTGDLVLLDPTMYVVGERMQAVVDVSADVPGSFEKNRSLIRTWLRVDGRPVLSGSVTLADATTTASSIVVLH